MPDCEGPQGCVAATCCTAVAFAGGAACNTLCMLPLTLCLFPHADAAGEGHKASKKKVREEQVAGISKVVGLSKLKTKYESYEAKRQLCNSYDLFLADERVLPSLPKLIGKSFFKKKKQPVPVRLVGKNWGLQVSKACNATYMYLTGGSSLSVRAAKASQAEEECVANVMAVLAGAVNRVPKKWAGISALYLKTGESVALPIYQAVPVEALRIEGAA